MTESELDTLVRLRDQATKGIERFNESLGVGQGSKEAWNRLVEQSKKPLGPNDGHVPQGRSA